MVICLLKTDGEGSEVIQLTGKSRYVFGRENADVILADDRCSRRHAALTVNDSGELSLEDMGSSNGTVVNKLKVQKAALKLQDTFRLGRTVFVILTLLSKEAAGPGQSMVQIPVQADGSLPKPPPLPETVSDAKQGLGSVLLNEWPNNFRSLPQSALTNFIDHLDEEQKQRSRRLIDIVRHQQK